MLNLKNCIESHESELVALNVLNVRPMRLSSVRHPCEPAVQPQLCLIKVKMQDLVYNY